MLAITGMDERVELLQICQHFYVPILPIKSHSPAGQVSGVVSSEATAIHFYNLLAEKAAGITVQK